MFQILIGKLETCKKALGILLCTEKFQILIGKLETVASLLLRNMAVYVSNPYR